MTRHTRNFALLAALAIGLFAAPPDAYAQIRTAPDIRNPGAQTGTGVNRLGIMTNSTGPRRTTQYVLPGGGYYYGYYPGRSFYYSNNYYGGGYYDNFYGDDYYVCPYCGNRWCNGGCRYRWGPLYLPPVVGDAGSLYGPRAMRQFLGVDGNTNSSQGGGPLRAAAAAAPEAPPPLSNPTTRALAWKFVEYGDRHFKKGDYHKALERYRKAESQADEIADIYFRQAFAQAGFERYPEAVVAMQQGLRLDPNWPSSGFVLEELFPDVDAKRAYYRQLHTYLADHPNDADAMFMLAVLQHFDGHEAAAEVRFRRVVELTGRGEHARAFLPLAPEAEDAGELQPELPPQ